MSFLPAGYQPPPSNSGRYLKLAKGPNKIRILGPAIVGTSYWTGEGENRRPVRVRPGVMVDQSKLGNDQFGNKEQPKHFWAFPCWSYASNEVKVLEITQVTIQGAIEELIENPDWGDPMRYDLTITKTGEGKEGTKYTVMPSPAKQLAANIQVALQAEPLPNLEALFDGADPFAAAGAAARQPQPAASGNGSAPAIDSTGVEEVIVQSVETKPVPNHPERTVYGINTDRGRFGTIDPGIGTQAIALQGQNRPVEFAWTMRPQGRRVDVINELQGAAEAEQIAEEDIPWA